MIDVSIKMKNFLNTKVFSPYFSLSHLFSELLNLYYDTENLKSQINNKYVKYFADMKTCLLLDKEKRLFQYFRQHIMMKQQE